MKEKAEALFNGLSYKLADVKTRTLRETQPDLNAAAIVDALAKRLAEKEVAKLHNTLLKYRQTQKWMLWLT